MCSAVGQQRYWAGWGGFTLGQVVQLSSAEPAGEASVSHLLRLISLCALFFWELCCLGCSCSFSSTPCFMQAWVHCCHLCGWHCSPRHISYLMFYFIDPHSQRGGKQRVAHSTCRHDILQLFKLRCWDVSREGLGSATFSAVLLCGTTSRMIRWSVGGINLWKCHSKNCQNLPIRNFRLSWYLQMVRVILLSPQICTDEALLTSLWYTFDNEKRVQVGTYWTRSVRR